MTEHKMTDVELLELLEARRVMIESLRTELLAVRNELTTVTNSSDTGWRNAQIFQRALTAASAQLEAAIALQNHYEGMANTTSKELVEAREAARSIVADVTRQRDAAQVECESLTKRINELEKRNGVMRGTVSSCSEARCKAEAEARMSTEHAAKYHSQIHSIRCAMEAKGFAPGIDIANAIREQLVLRTAGDSK